MKGDGKVQHGLVHKRTSRVVEVQDELDVDGGCQARGGEKTDGGWKNLEDICSPQLVPRD